MQRVHRLPDCFQTKKNRARNQRRTAKEKRSSPVCPLKRFLAMEADTHSGEGSPFCPFFTHYQFRQQNQSAALTIMTEFDPFLVFLAMFGLLTSWIAGMSKTR